MIYDQRHMTGGVLVEGVTPDYIEEIWRAIAAGNPAGFANRPGARELVETGESVRAYVNHSRWVADCPACNGGIACWPENPRCACLDCGRIYRASFPRSAKKIEKALLERPEEINRNWLPEETLDDLREQNKAARELGLMK